MGYKDKEKQRAYNVIWNKKNNDYVRNYRSKRRREARKLVDSLKDKCIRCGYNKCKAALDWHHKAGGRNTPISKAVDDRWGQERLLAELELCEVLCSNCHREEHDAKRKG